MMDIKEISEYLPHRYPFLLVDRVVSVEPGDTIKGYKNVSVNEIFFNGHFPGNPVMPGVLMVEAMAQLSGILAFKTKNRKAADGSMYYLGGVDRVRFKRPVVPGDRLDMESKIVADKRHVMKFACSAYVDGELACEAEVICVEKEI
jgi:3-hydroxyacyl-[acyl-carrier-protein] dehydratase